MIPLITVENHYAKPNPELRAIPVFRDLISRDRGSENDADGRKKLQASRELAWIYFMSDPLSPYQTLEEEERLYKVGDVMFGDKNFKPDDTMIAAMERYEEMVTTLPVKLLESAQSACRNLIKFLDEVDLTERDDKNKPVYKVNDVMRALKDIGDVVDTLDKVEERVKKQRDKEAEIRGGQKLNEFNR